MHAIEIFNKVDTYYILIVPSKVQMLICMPTLQHLTYIICKQEVLNIVNIANLVPQGLVNKNQSTGKCTIICFTSTSIYIHLREYIKNLLRVWIIMLCSLANNHQTHLFHLCSPGSKIIGVVEIHVHYITTWWFQ